MAKKPDIRYENNYRYTPEQMKGLWKRFFIGWGISALGALIIILVLSIVSFDPSSDGDSYPAWVSTAGAATIILGVLGFPLIYSAWLGGRAIHRWGPLGTMTVVIGMFFAVGGSDAGQPYIGIGIVLMAVGVIITFYFGKTADVPIWLQLPILKSPRLYLNKPTPKKPRKNKK